MPLLRSTALLLGLTIALWPGVAEAGEAPEAPLDHDGLHAHPVTAACGPDGSWLIAWTARRADRRTTPLAFQVLDRRGLLGGETVRRTGSGDARGPVAVGDGRGWVVAFEGPDEGLWALAVAADGQADGEPSPLDDDGADAGGRAVWGLLSPHE